MLGVHLFLQLSSDGGSRTFFISAVRKGFLISNEKFFVYVHPCSVLRGPEQKWLRNLPQLGVCSCTGQNLASAHFTGRDCSLATVVSPGARRRHYSKILTLEGNGTQRGVQENVKALSGLLTHLLYSSLYVDQLSLPLPPHESQASSLIASPPLIIFIQSCEVLLYLFYVIETKAQKGEMICSRSANQQSSREGI